MRILGTAALCLMAGELGALSTDWEAFFRQAWSTSPSALVVDLTRTQAQAAWALEQARWFPTLSVESLDATRPQQISGGGSGSGGWLTTAAALAVALRPAGGGLVRAAVEGSSESLEPLEPVYSLEATLPLARLPAREVARLSYEVEVFQNRRSALAGWQDLVRAASKLDLARLAAESQKSLCAGARHRFDRLQELRAQGRETEATLVAAEGAWIRALRDKAEAEVALRSATAAWDRLSSLPLPTVEAGPLKAWARDRPVGSTLLELDQSVLTLRRMLEGQRSAGELAALAPVIGLKFTSARPGEERWAWTGQVGLSLSTDLFILGPWIVSGCQAADRRWSCLIGDAAREASDRTALGDLRLDQLQHLGEALELQSRKVLEVRQAFVQEAARQGVPLSEVLSLDAELAALALEARRLVWDEILERVAR